MESTEPSRPWNRRRLVVIAILFASVAVNVVFLAIFFSRPDKPGVQPGPPAVAAPRPNGTVQAAIPPAQGSARQRPERRDDTTEPLQPRPRDREPALGAGSTGREGVDRDASEASGPALALDEPRVGLPPPPAQGGSTTIAAGAGSPQGPRPDPAEHRPPASGYQDPVAPLPLHPNTALEASAPLEDEATADDHSPGSDRTAPVLGSLRFEPPEVADGAATSFLIEVTDDMSGVKAVSGNIRSPSGAAMIPFQAQGDSQGGAFLARIQIPAKAETGNWYLAYLSVLDQADNPMVGSFTPQSVPPGGSLRVHSTDSDSTPPELHGVSLAKRAVNGGEPNVVILDIDDDHSGVASIMGAFQSATKAGLIRFVGRATNDPRVWEGDLSVPASAECGEWTAQFVRAVDNAGNIAYLSSETQPLAGVGFNVSGSSCDSTPPALESLTLTPTTVSNETASEIQVSAVVRDEGSGTASMLGWVNGPPATNGQTPRIFFSCTKSAPAPDAPWVGKILMPPHAGSGVWKLGLVRLQDKALNSRDYGPDDPILQQSTFQVQ